MTTLLQFMKDKLMMAKVLHKPSKHSASKKGYKHQHNLSKGQRKDADKKLKELGDKA